MLIVSTVLTSLVALNVLLASTGQGQVEANVLRRSTAGHETRQSHVIQGLLDVAGRDESFQRRRVCKAGFYACSDGIGCCRNRQTCDHLPDGTPTCCCTKGGNCASGELPCSGNAHVCCPNGDLCSSNGTCSSTGSSGDSSSGNSSSGSGSGGNGNKSGEAGLRAGTAVVMMGGVMIASALVLSIL